MADREHLVLPYSLTYNDAKLVAPIGSDSPQSFADTIIAAIDELREEGRSGHPKMLSVGLHPRLVGQAGRTAGLRRVVEHCLSAGDVWVARRTDIAAEWLRLFGPAAAGQR